MSVNKNPSKYFFLAFFKVLFFIIGLNIFSTSIFKIIKLELKKNNSESVINLNIRKLKYDQNFQFDSDIY